MTLADYGRIALAILLASIGLLVTAMAVYELRTIIVPLAMLAFGVFLLALGITGFLIETGYLPRT